MYNSLSTDYYKGHLCFICVENVISDGICFCFLNINRYIIFEFKLVLLSVGSVMDYKLLADTAMLAGELMLQSGAETFRVEETITRILKTSGQERTEAIAYATGIMMTLDGKDSGAISLVVRIGDRDTNLGQVCEVNNISRSYCDGKITLEEANRRLKAIRGVKRYPDWVIVLCAVITSAAFTLLLGGGFYDCLFAALYGVLQVIFLFMNRKIRINRFILNLITAFFVALMTEVLVIASSLPINQELLIAGSIMPMLPGVSLTNALRDTLQGDYMSGTVRTIEALMVAVSIAIGIGAGLFVGALLF